MSRQSAQRFCDDEVRKSKDLKLGKRNLGMTTRFGRLRREPASLDAFSSHGCHGMRNARSASIKGQLVVLDKNLQLVRHVFRPGDVPGERLRK